MRVLLDSCVPQRLRHAIPGHQVETATFAGLDGATDSQLLEAMSGRFDVLVTVDRGIPWQQDMRGRSVAVVVLISPSNRLSDLLSLVPALVDALSRIGPGDVRHIGGAANAGH